MSLIRHSHQFWRTVPPSSIPTKHCVHDLFYSTLEALAVHLGRPLRVLDAGCGDGRIALALCGREGPWDGGDDRPLVGSIVGVDINEPGVACATAMCAETPTLRNRASFAVADVTGPLDALLRAVDGAAPKLCSASATASTSSCSSAPAHKSSAGTSTPASASALLGGTFDVVLAQLLISIVGGACERKQMLKNFKDLLCARGAMGMHVDAPVCRGGLLLCSASGDSASVNSKYKALYETDAALTGEDRTYISRDASSGEALYLTHHFDEHELRASIAAAGFNADTIEIASSEEHSSRRPDERAVFLYAVAEA